jgi:hypothetical protein
MSLLIYPQIVALRAAQMAQIFYLTVLRFSVFADVSSHSGFRAGRSEEVLGCMG